MMSYRSMQRSGVLGMTDELKGIPTDKTKRRNKMKQKVKVEEVDGEGLVGLLGKRVTLYCLNFIYTGDLVGVNDTFVKLKDAGIVYETGSHSDKDWSDYQPFPKEFWYIKRSSIESFGEFK